MFLLQATQPLPFTPTTSVSPSLVAAIAIASLLIGIVLLLASTKLRSADSQRLKKWSIIAIVFAILSNLIGVLNLGFILSLIGGLAGLWYSKKQLTSRPLAPFALVLLGGLIVFFLALVPLLFGLGLFNL